MNNVVCSKCGGEAISKCPICRNVFPSDQIATLYNNLIDLDISEPQEVEYLGGKKDTIRNISFKLEFTHSTTEKDTPEEHLLELLKNLLALEYPERAICNHSWKFKPGEKSSIGCGHG